jgi:hypothetical protein
MPDYRIRRATVGDASVLLHHRIAMFTEMGLTFDTAAVAAASARWLAEAVPSELYRAWLVETTDPKGPAGVILLSRAAG